MSLQQCHPNSAGSLVIARRTECNPHCFVVFFVLLATPQTGGNGVLRKLKHIFPNTYQRIKSICSPAKVRLVVTDLITSPVVSWRGWETPPQHRGSAVILCMTSSEVSGAGGGPSYLFFGKY